MARGSSCAGCPAVSGISLLPALFQAHDSIALPRIQCTQSWKSWCQVAAAGALKTRRVKILISWDMYLQPGQMVKQQHAAANTKPSPPPSLPAPMGTPILPKKHIHSTKRLCTCDGAECNLGSHFKPCRTSQTYRTPHATSSATRKAG